jgi:hypothetical protein
MTEPGPAGDRLAIFNFSLTDMYYRKTMSITIHHREAAMAEAAQSGRRQDSKRPLDGARAFSRAMTWICSSLSVILFAGLAGVVTIIVLVTDTTTIPCDSAGVHMIWPGDTHFDCHKDPSIQTVIEHRANGRTTTRTTKPPAQLLGAKEVLGVALPLAPAAVLALALWQAGRFFAQLSKGRAFQARTVARLRNFSALGVLLLVLDPLMPKISATIDKALNLGVTVVAFTPDISGWRPTLPDLLNIAFAATLIAMVSVLARAAALAEDHAQIV